MPSSARGALAVLILSCVLFGQDRGGAGGNSMRKYRPGPSEQAARVGSAIPWRQSVTEALREAKETRKPVFWYVPTVARSPMDRKAEIDLYMRGGPFSWPTTIALLTDRFVPVDEVPRGELQQRYDLTRQRFLEPGYLVLDVEGEVLLRVDQITTFHPGWFEAPLRRLVKANAEGFPGSPALREAWTAFGAGDLPAALQFAEAMLARERAAAVAAEAHWLCGAVLHRTGRPKAARARWTTLAAELPEQPLAWKAALEAEGHGPFALGFETYTKLSTEVLAADPVDGSRAPEGVYDEAELWRRSVAFLLSIEDGNGVVRDSRYDFGGTDSLPNVYAAVTCLCGLALLAAEERFEDGQLPSNERIMRRLGAVLERIRKNVASDAWLALSDRDEIVWARAYAVRFLAAWRHRHGADDEASPALQRTAAALLALQPGTGAWFHEYGNPFATATALQALHEARVAGADVDPQVVALGLRALLRDRTPAGAFTYGHTRRGKPRASTLGSAGRMPLCELALFLHGKSDQQRLRAAVATGREHHGLLAAVRKYDDHADRYGNGGFFFWFDMLGRTEAIARIEDAEARRDLVRFQRRTVLGLPEFDGCFVDSHELGRAYGTAMALLCLDALSRVEGAGK